MKNVKVKIFDDYVFNVEKAMNKFIVGKEVVDVKTNLVVAANGNFFSRYLVIYKEESK